MIEIKCDICGGPVTGTHDDDRGPVYFHGWINNKVKIGEIELLVDFNVRVKNKKLDICEKCGWAAIKKAFEQKAGQKGLFE